MPCLYLYYYLTKKPVDLTKTRSGKSKRYFLFLSAAIISILLQKFFAKIPFLLNIHRNISFRSIACLTVAFSTRGPGRRRGNDAHKMQRHHQHHQTDRGTFTFLLLTSRQLPRTRPRAHVRKYCASAETQILCSSRQTEHVISCALAAQLRVSESTRLNRIEYVWTHIHSYTQTSAYCV